MSMRIVMPQGAEDVNDMAQARRLITQLRAQLALQAQQGEAKDAVRRQNSEFANSENADAPAVAPSPPEDLEWRRLALQFDGHRMQALGHLKCLLKSPQEHKTEAEKFLSSGPLSGEEVLAERIKALVPAPATLSDDAIIAQWLELDSWPSDNGGETVLYFARALLAAAGSSQGQDEVANDAMRAAASLCRRISQFHSGADVFGWVEVHSKLVAALAAKEAK